MKDFKNLIESTARSSSAMAKVAKRYLKSMELGKKGGTYEPLPGPDDTGRPPRPKSKRKGGV